MSKMFSTLVIGCKKHEQVADRFFALANIFWPELLDSIIFCTDEITTYQNNFAKNRICNKPSLDYSERILNGLMEVNSDYVLLLLDDYYFSEQINNSEFESLIDNLRNEQIEYCKLIGLPKSFKRYKKIKSLHYIKEKTHYGVSLQPSIWKKTALIEALLSCTGSSAWQVEGAFSSFQKKNHEKCFTFNKNYLFIENGVLRGKLAPHTNRLLRKNNIEELDMEKVSSFRYHTFMLRQHIAMHLPIFVRSFGKKIGKLFGKKYYSDK